MKWSWKLGEGKTEWHMREVCFGESCHVFVHRDESLALACGYP